MIPWSDWLKLKHTKTELKSEYAKRELANRDFLYYVKYIKKDYQFLAQRNGESLHLKMINKIKEVLDWKIKRIMVTCPPRLWKTETWTKLLSSYFIWKYPDKSVILTWYNTNLAIWFSRETRDIVDSQEYKNIFPNVRLKVDKKQAWDWEVTDWGWMFATGIWWTLTWKGWDLAILDDPVKNPEEAASFVIQERNNKWYESVLKTRLQNEDSITILIMTRRHPNDLAWYLLEKERLWWPTWEKLIIPAIDESWFEIFRKWKRGTWFFCRLRDDTPPAVWHALYQQDPISARNSLLQFSLINYFSLADLDNPLIPNLTKRSFQYWLIVDPAFSTATSSDDVVVLFCGRHKIDNTLYIFDWFYWTKSPSVSFKAIINFLITWKQIWQTLEFLSVEDVAINVRQTQFIKDLKDELLKAKQGVHFHHYKPRENKEARISLNIEPILSLWGVFVRKDHPDRMFERKLEQQMSDFPHWKHDDIIDCISQAVDVFNLKYTLPWKEDESMYNKPEEEAIELDTLKNIELDVLWD